MMKQQIQHQRSAHNDTVLMTKNEDETPENLKNWITLETGSTTHLSVNLKIVCNIRDSDGKNHGVTSNGGNLDICEVADIKGISTAPHASKGIANSFSVAKLMAQGF